jgi:transposase
MARLPGGHEVLEEAMESLAKAKGADELRTLQAVVFPLSYGMSTEETAQAVGRSERWVSKARGAFIRSGGMPDKPPRTARNRANLTAEEEKEFLAPFFEEAMKGGMLVATEVHEALERHLGRNVCLATAYNLLHRNGWRKLVPDKCHVSADARAQEDFKKNCRSGSRRSRRSGTGRARSG